ASPHSPDLAGAVILSHKGGDGNPECVDDHPERSVDLAKRSPGSHIICSQAVDKHLDHDIGHTVHGGFKSRRNTDTHHRAKRIHIKTYFLQPEATHFLFGHQHPGYNTGADPLTEDRCRGSSRHAHLKHHHQKKVQDN